MARLPFTTSLTNIGFIAKIALLARLGVAVIRTVMNAPFMNRNENMTPKEKRASCIERATIELLGTAIYASGMYLAMDGVAGLFERFRLKPQFEALKKTIEAFDEADGGTRLSTIFHRTFSGGLTKNGAPSGKVSNLIHKYILGDDFKSRYSGVDGWAKAGYWEFKDQLDALSLKSSKQVDNILEAVGTFSRKLNKVSMLTQFAGIAAACVLGGPILQTFNDKVVRPFALHLSGTQNIGLKKSTAPVVRSLQAVNKQALPEYLPAVNPSSLVVKGAMHPVGQRVKSYRPGFVPFEPLTASLEQILPSVPPSFSLHQAPISRRQAAPVFQSVQYQQPVGYSNLGNSGGATWLR